MYASLCSAFSKAREPQDGYLYFGQPDRAENGLFDSLLPEFSKDPGTYCSISPSWAECWFLIVVSFVSLAVYGRLSRRSEPWEISHQREEGHGLSDIS